MYLRAYDVQMNDDDHVCLCFKVSKRKIVNFCKRQRPRFASQLSECLSAGTGCRWCVPFLKQLHEQVLAGCDRSGLPAMSSQEYAAQRAKYRKTGRRD